MTRRAKLLLALLLTLTGTAILQAQVFHQAGADFYQLLYAPPSPCVFNPSSTALVPCTANSQGTDLIISPGQGVGTAAVNNVRFRGYAVGTVSGTTPQGAPIDRLVIGTHVGLPAQTTVPTVTAACGTSPSIVGSDNAFQLNVGTGGSATTCTVTFNQPYLVKPVCTVTDETTQAITTTAVPSTTTIVITTGTAWTASSILDVICFGN